MVDLTLNAVRYPLQKILAAPVTADDQLERNGTLSNGTKVRGGLSGRPAFAFGVHRRDDFGHDAAIKIRALAWTLWCSRTDHDDGSRIAAQRAGQ